MSLLVIGLGNPGKEYSLNRHNIGFRVADRIAELTATRLKKAFLRKYMLGRKQIEGTDFAVAKPLTFMNRSGDVVFSLLRVCRMTVSDLLIVCDHLDLPPGQCRLKRKGSSAGHNGLKSIIQALETEHFMRMYIGIGWPKGHASVVEHVVGDPGGEEAVLYETAVLQAAQGILKLLTEPVEYVMNEINRKDG